MKFFVRDDNGNETELDTTILSLKEEDVIILKSLIQVPAKDFNKIVKSFNSHFKHNDCIGIGPDLDIGVIRKE